MNLSVNRLFTVYLLLITTSIFSLIFSVGANSQSLDSLLLELPKQKEDTNKVILLDKIIDVLFDDPVKQPPFIEAMLSLSKKLNYSWGESRAYFMYGAYNSYINRWDEALIYLHKADSMYKKYGNTYGQACVKNMMGKYYNTTGKFEEALQCYQASLSYFEQINSDKALRNQGVNLSYIALLFQKMKRYEEAEYYYLRSIDIRQKIGDEPGIAATLNNLGSMLLEQEQFDKALVYLKKCLQVEQNMGEKAELYVITNCKANIGYIYINKQRCTEALAIFNECYTNYGKMGDTINMGTMHVYRAYAYRKLGMPDKSLEQLNAGVALIIPFQPENEELSDFYAEYYEAYKALGKYKEALESYEKYVEYNQDIFSTETANHVSELKEKYETEKKEQENIALKNQQEIQSLRLQQQRYFIYGLGGILVLLIVIAILLIRTTRIVALHKNMQLEQRLLRSQMNPHFVFNALIAIQSYLFKSDPKSAGKFLSSFAKLMRGILENSREEYISIHREVQWLENYVSLQKLRFDNRFEYSIHVDENIDQETTLIPPMLTQPFIENALEHGLSKKEQPGKLEIWMKETNGLLSIQVSDDGVGFDPNGMQSDYGNHRSLALQITKDRLRLLNKGKMRKIQLEISSQLDKGTTVSFSIPIKHK